MIAAVTCGCKLPHCENYETVARATTLPILLLRRGIGGRSLAVPAATGLGDGRRGRICPRRAGGQKCSYTQVMKIRCAMAEAAGGIVHDGWSRGHGIGIDGGKPRARPGPARAGELRRMAWKHVASRWLRHCWAS